MIRAGRSVGGQPTPPDPADPEAGAPADPAAGASTGGTSPTVATATAGSASATATAQAARTAQDEQTAQDEETADGEAAESPAHAAETGTAAGGEARSAFRRAVGHAWVRHLALLLIYEGAGIAATWPRFTYLADGKLPATADVSSFVWNLWWTAHQLVHAGNPFFTTYMAAPVGTHLAFSTLMPLAGWLMSPVTVLYGPSASFTLLTIITPGLLCYAMYRAARLWLNEPGAIVAGAFFGLSSMLLWQNWYHVNIAIGTIFLPVTIEAAVRFRRKPHAAPAIALGTALGASILVNQESTVVALLLAAFILVPWLVGALIRDRALLLRVLKPLGLGALIAIVVASPQLIAMLQQIVAGGANPPPGQLAANYAQFGASLPTLFAPSPRLASFGLGNLATPYSYYNSEQVLEGLPTFGAVLSALALLGIIAGWRKRGTWAFLGLWLIGGILALGTSLTFGSGCQISQGINYQPGKAYGPMCTQYIPLATHIQATKVVYKGGPPNGVWEHVMVSNLMPYTWLVRIPGLSGLREADRFALAGLIGAAMLAGLTVQWLSKRKVTMPLIAVVVALGALEAGWSGDSLTSPGYHGTMPTTLPALDRPLTRDHSGSIVVDVPFGLRGGVGFTGVSIAPNAMLIATHDQHPRAIAYEAWVPKSAIKGIASHAFYRFLYIKELPAGDVTARQMAKARADLRTLNVGWVVEWRNVWTQHHPWARYKRVTNYLEAVGFRHTGDACLVDQVAGVGCPGGFRVWLFQYQPGKQAGG